MITSKSILYILLATVLPLMFLKANAQSLDEQTYLHKMQLMDSLSFYKMKDLDTLYQVSILKNFRGTGYKEDYYGWVNKQSQEHILFLSTNGKEIEIEKKEITGIKALPFNQETIDSLTKGDRGVLLFDGSDFARNYELILWLYKKGKIDYSKQLLPQEPAFFADTDVRNGFGALYYNDMLSAYSYQRDYPKAIAFGEHLSDAVFKGYQYQKEAITLTRQLKNSPEDFKTFRLPDSLTWSKLKQKLTRKEQILYLVDRLRLLNCIQPGQPAGISYDMNQYAISFTESTKLNISYWGNDAKYTVINPFTELLQMKLNLHEMELLSPSLLTDDFIPSYTYHRDFFPTRNLHKLSWVAERLIFEITDKRFFNRFYFDGLTPDQKKAEVEKIKKWCDDNSGLSPTAFTVKELKTADNWNDFYAALQTAVLQKNDSLLSIITQRFNDFNDGSFPSSKAIMAETMFEEGGKEYVGSVRKWSKDTTDTWLNLWTAMYLIKYDKDSYEPTMKTLEGVLKECDGTTYYPHAIDLLLSMKNARTLKLAEGILDKSAFQQLIYWDYYENIIRKLLLAKSKYTFNFLSAKLNAYNSSIIKNLHSDNDHVLTQNDAFVLAVDELKNDKAAYENETTNIAREEYIKALAKWFKAQYVLMEKDKPNELHLDIKQTDAPVSFVDTYYR